MHVCEEATLAKESHVCEETRLVKELPEGIRTWCSYSAGKNVCPTSQSKNPYDHRALGRAHRIQNIQHSTMKK